MLFDDGGLRRIAERAGAEQTGARGLMTVCERVFRHIKFELPSTDVKRFIVTRELVDDPPGELQKLASESQREGRLMAKQLVEEFAERFHKQHGLALHFTPPAIDLLITKAAEQSVPVRDLCARLFKDYQFGLKLIAQNTGHPEFELDAAAVEAPDKYLSDLVVASYREGTPAA